MANIRPINPNIRRKTSGLLDGLLGALYAGSRAEENPAFSPGVEGFTPDASVQPFRGRGLFGAGQANQLNNQVAMERILQQQKINLEQALADRLASEEGAALATLWQNASPEERAGLNIPQLGQAPIDDKFRSQLVRAFGGNQYVSEGFAGLPGHRIKQQLESFGSGGKLNVVTGDVFEPTTYINEQELIPEYEPGITASGKPGQVVKGYKTKITPIQKPASIRKIENLVTQDELNAAGDLELSDAEIYGTRNITPSYTSGISERLAPASSGAEMTADDARIKAPIVTPKQTYEGVLPELSRGISSGIKAPIPDFSGTGIGRELGTATESAGTELSNLRKLLIRKPEEKQIQPKEPIDIFNRVGRGLMTTGQEAAQPLIDIFRGIFPKAGQDKTVDNTLRMLNELQSARRNRLGGIRSRAFNQPIPVEETVENPILQLLLNPLPDENLTRSSLRINQRGRPGYRPSPY